MYKWTIFILKIYIRKEIVSNLNIKIKDLDLRDWQLSGRAIVKTEDMNVCMNVWMCLFGCVFVLKYMKALKRIRKNL